MTKTSFNKPALTFNQQLDVLEKRGLVIPDRTKAEHYLKHLNYYRLCAYWLPYEANHDTHEFIAGTQFDSIINDYVFDRELRLLIMDAIERIEVSIKTSLAYHLAHNHGAHPHLSKTLFSNSQRYDALIKILERNVTASTEKFILHFKQKYTNTLPPIWALVEIMTLGQISKLYENLKYSRDKKSIAKEYKLPQPVLQSLLVHLTTVRNNCAHHSRTWNRTFAITFTKPKKAPSFLLESFNSNTNADHKIYNTLVMLAYLMDNISPDHSWKDRVIQLLSNQKNQSSMGCPSNFQTLPIWQ